MIVQHVSPSDLKREYGILCQRLYPLTGEKTPFGSTWCVVEPLGSTLPHDHHEGEVFLIFSGKGKMTIDTEIREVGVGDIIHIPPFSRHVLENPFAEEIRFVSIYWEIAAEKEVAELPERVFVTVAPPTPNGDLHLGHMAGPYLASDSYARAYRLRGVPTVLVTGSDDNQSYVVTKGLKMGMSSNDVAAHFAARNHSTLRSANIRLQEFLRPGENLRYVKFVQDFFRKLYEDGKLETKDADSLYCERCEKYLYEAFVRGGCPQCGELTNGNGCERCGHTNDCINLLEPVCNQCQNRAEIRTFRRLYFPLSSQSEALKNFHTTVKMSRRLRALTTEITSGELADVSVSHLSTWGIPVGIPGFEGQVIYEWLEMAAGYLFLAQEHSLSGDAAEIWKNSRAKVVQFFGFDNGFFYTTFIPAVLLAHDSKTQLPFAFESNEFYQLEGLKFSTSRNHAVWADDVLSEVPADVMRFFLATTRPESEETNFSMVDFAETVDRELYGRWHLWLEKVSDNLGEFEGLAPELELLTAEGKNFYTTLGRQIERLKTAYSPEEFSLATAAAELKELVRIASRFTAGAKFANENQNERKEAMALELLAVKTLALFSAPIMPAFGERLLDALGTPEEKRRWTSALEAIPTDQAISDLDGFEFEESRNRLWRLATQRKEKGGAQIQAPMAMTH